MLTINQITDNKEAVIAGLNKKHFANAGEVIAQVLDVNNQRKECQTQLDENLAQQNKIAKSIGLLMREGKKDEAEQAKADVAGLKADSKVMQDKKAELEEQLQQLLYTIPNVPYDEVPEGFGAEDNVVVKTGGTANNGTTITGGDKKWYSKTDTADTAARMTVSLTVPVLGTSDT